jgi:hypothetical protein
LLVRKVPSMQMTGRQNLKAWMQAPNAKNDRWSTSLHDFSSPWYRSSRHDSSELLCVASLTNCGRMLHKYPTYAPTPSSLHGMPYRNWWCTQTFLNCTDNCRRCKFRGFPISKTLIFYYYDYGIVCTIITITMVLYSQLLLWHCLYAKLWYYSFGEVLW